MLQALMNAFEAILVLTLFSVASSVCGEDPRLVVELEGTGVVDTGLLTVTLRNEGQSSVSLPLFEDRPHVFFEIWSGSIAPKFRRKSEIEIDSGGGFAPGLFSSAILPPSQSKSYVYKMAELSSGRGMNPSSMNGSWVHHSFNG